MGTGMGGIKWPPERYLKTAANLARARSTGVGGVLRFRHAGAGAALLAVARHRALPARDRRARDAGGGPAGEDRRHRGGRDRLGPRRIGPRRRRPPPPWSPSPWPPRGGRPPTPGASD